MKIENNLYKNSFTLSFVIENNLYITIMLLSSVYQRHETVMLSLTSDVRWLEHEFISRSNYHLTNQFYRVELGPTQIL
jgi:hypothetical protein